MWSVWGFCSPVRRVDQLIDSSFLLTDFGANFSKKVWVFLVEILGFFCFLVSSKILGSFSKLIFFVGFLVLNFLWFGVFFRDSSKHTRISISPLFSNCLNRVYTFLRKLRSGYNFFMHYFMVGLCIEAFFFYDRSLLVFRVNMQRCSSSNFREHHQQVCLFVFFFFLFY